MSFRNFILLFLIKNVEKFHVHFMGSISWVRWFKQSRWMDGMKVFILDEISPKTNQKKRWE
jgi:hypothetical protein